MTDQGAVTQAALNRLENQAEGQAESSSRQLALTPYEYGDQPIMPLPANPTPQDQSAQVQRLSTGQWDGYTGRLNHAQAAQPGSAVWVTVPVDKVVTTPGGASSATPVYASTKGYVPRPGESRGSLPPPVATGHPYP